MNDFDNQSEVEWIKVFSQHGKAHSGQNTFVTCVFAKSTGCDHLLEHFVTVHCSDPTLLERLQLTQIKRKRRLCIKSWLKQDGLLEQNQFQRSTKKLESLSQIHSPGQKYRYSDKGFRISTILTWSVPWLKWHLEEWTSPHLVTRLHPPKVPIWQSTEWREASVLLEELLYRKFDN